MREVRYLNERQVSAMIGRALSSLRNDRFFRKGIPYVKMGRSVRYSYQDVIAFIERRRMNTEESL